MNFGSHARITVFLVGLLLSAPAFATKGSVTVSSGNDSRDVTVSFRNEGKHCGMAVDFGDGQSKLTVLRRRKSSELHYKYMDVGEFMVTVSGSQVKSGNKTYEPCDFGAEASVNVEPKHYLLLGSPYLFATIKGLDGRERIALAADTSSEGMIWACYVPSSRNPATTQELYLQAAENELKNFLEGLGQPNNRTADAAYCDFRNQPEHEWQGMFWVSGLVIVPPEYLEKVQKAMNENGLPTYWVIGRVSQEKIDQEVVKAQEIAQAEHEENERKRSAMAEELDRLAAAKSNDKIGSLSFDAPWQKGPVRFCTLSYEGASAIAISEYGRLAPETLSDQFQSVAMEAGATFNQDRPFQHAFSDIETMYRAWQQDHSDCQVYVDFPENLKRLADAVQRDSDVKVSINKFIPASHLRNSWAGRRGYASYENYVVIDRHMRQMNVKEDQYRALSELGVRDKASMDSAIDEMNRAGYSNSESRAVLVDYLRDKATAADRPGATAVSIRDTRNAREAAVRARAVPSERSNNLADSDLSSISGFVCQQHEHVLSHVIAGYREAGVPLGNAQSVFDSESDPSLRRFLKAATSGLYVNPEGASRHIQSGEFLRACIRIHRGY